MSREDREQFNPFRIKDLPEDLNKELNLKSEFHNKVLDVFKNGGGVLNTSEILIGLFKMHGEVKTRQFMSGTLYRMRKKKLIYPTGRKGEYTIEKAIKED